MYVSYPYSCHDSSSPDLALLLTDLVEDRQMSYKYSLSRRGMGRSKSGPMHTFEDRHHEFYVEFSSKDDVHWLRELEKMRDRE